MRQPFSFCRFRKESWDARISGFLAAVHSQEPVTGLTHNFYRYPARFSPQFARAAIEVFSEPGDVVLDPFMGSGTTLVEASALGRHSLGSDISALAVFLARVKTTPLSEKDLLAIKNWAYGLREHLNLRRPAIRAKRWQASGYQRHAYATMLSNCRNSSPSSSMSWSALRLTKS